MTPARQPSISARSRHVDLPGVVNLRDVGGLPLAGGGSVRPGRLFRGAALGTLRPEAATWFDASPIDTVFDLRTLDERTRLPDDLGTRRAVTHVHLPLLEGSLQASLAGLPTLPDLYRTLLDHDAAVFVRIARTLAIRSDSGVLVHCTAGKDRTGVAVALILLAVDTRQDAVVTDYAATTEQLAGSWLEGALQRVRAAGGVLTDELVTLIAEAPPAALEAAIDHLDTTHGGAAEYLARNGLGDGELDALRDSLQSPLAI